MKCQLDRLISKFLVSCTIVTCYASTAFAQSTERPATPPNLPSSIGGGSLDELEMRHNLRDSAAAFAPDRDTVASMERYSQTLKVAECIVSRSKRQALKAIEAQPSSPAESRQYARTFGTLQSCGPQYTTILSLQRGSWSEALYKKLHKKPLSPGVGDEASALAFVNAEKPWNALRTDSDRTMIGATNCLVASNPVIADETLRSSHGSNEEALLMDELFAEAPQCAGATRPSTVSRTFLRAYIADSLYRAIEGEYHLPNVGK